MRVIITGSRKFSERNAISQAIAVTIVDNAFPITFVHGDCPTGADRIASEIINLIRDAYSMEECVLEEKHPADWSRKCTESCYHRPRLDADNNMWCPMAGHIRNQEMVDLGADICLAFLRNDCENSGTMDMIKRCEKAGIPVSTFWQV